MEPTDVIKLESAKDWLSTTDETHLPRLIKSALDWVESYTGHSLYTKEFVTQMSCDKHPLVEYPLVINSVKDKDGNALEYSTSVGVYNVYVHAPAGSYVYGTKGYARLYDIPSELLDAAYKMLTYLHENRDVYTLQAPTDIKLLVNKQRRNLI